MTASRIEFSPPAKINLALAVRGRRDDGFHEIESWVVKLDWTDRLWLAPSDALTLEISGAGADSAIGVPGGPDNLVCKAAIAMAQAANRPAEVAIQLTKFIPAGAGLGGGSSDAACTLIGLNELWNLNWSVERLAELGAALGSDVPFFLHRGPMFMAGRGERLSALTMNKAFWVCLILPPFPLSTADVYRAWAACGSAGATAPRSLSPKGPAPLSTAAALADQLFNDLEAPAFALSPALNALHKTLDGLRGVRVRMTGSGSTLFAIFDDRESAEDWRQTAFGCCHDATRFQIVQMQTWA
ncbi:MAG: 4-(cytidine 5'-diphospho)-2-C-methyl-D-erythritol kinase [Phycisphaerae bacterium]|nr:4-(cytidine 5'-diphospho)-2-C-methyl-D-erythritol kinase [Phycisphaerae bacterium]